MVGDEEVDSNETLDEGSASFCPQCRSIVDRKLARFRDASAAPA
jgi:hypothetical protein